MGKRKYGNILDINAVSRTTKYRYGKQLVGTKDTASREHSRERGHPAARAHQYSEDFDAPNLPTPVLESANAPDNMEGYELQASSSSTSNECRAGDDTDAHDCDSCDSGEESGESTFDDSDGEKLPDRERDWDVPLFCGSLLTKGHAILLVLSFIIAASLTNDAVQNFLELLALLLPADSVLPRSRHLLEKYTRQRHIRKHFFCPQCSSYLGVDEGAGVRDSFECGDCNIVYPRAPLIKKMSYFLHQSIESQLRVLLEGLQLGSKLGYRFERKHIRGIGDIYDGSCYREFQNGLLLRDSAAVSLMCSSDGVAASKSSRKSYWPVLLIINELPPKLRKLHTIVAGVWVGRKPAFSTFFKPVIDELKHLLLCTCDTVARQYLQNHTSFNGAFGCNWCLHPGQMVAKGGGQVRVYSSATSARMRTSQHKKRHAEISNITGGASMGVKGNSVFFGLDGFHDVEGFVVDVMHAVYLGVVRQLLGLFFDSAHSNQDYYIGQPNSVKEIDRLMLQIKVPANLARTPRPVSERAQWKATEYRNFLLYYGPYVLKSTLPPRYYRHFLLLSEAITMLMADVVCEEDLQKSADKLCDFCTAMEHLYGLQEMSFNIHQLVHLADHVRRWGPPWGYSMDGPENTQGKLSRYIKGSQHIGNQILRRMSVLNVSIGMFVAAINQENPSPMTAPATDLARRILRLVTTDSKTNIGNTVVVKKTNFRCCVLPRDIERKCVILDEKNNNIILSLVCNTKELD